MNRYALIAVLLFFINMTSASVLGDLAIALPERTFVKLPAPTFEGLNLPRSSFPYSDSGCWDPVRKQIRWITNGGSCCSDGSYFLVTYDEATDTWSKRSTSLPKGSGHAYDGNALDPATGDSYFTSFRSTTIRKYNGQTWSTEQPITYYAAAAMSMTWFPEINGGSGGLVHVSTNYLLSWYDGARWNTLPRPPTDWGKLHLFSQYNPRGQFVWLGGGNEGANIHYKLDAGLNLTKFSNAPFNLIINSTLQSVCPVSGKHIVTRFSDNTWWEFDPFADKWTQITNASGAPTRSKLYGIQVPISDHGIILYAFGHSGPTEVFLYKHTESTNVDLNTAIRPAGSYEFSVTPNPFAWSTRISVKRDNREKMDVKIYNLNGQFVEDLTHHQPLTWNGSGRPPGIYLVKLSIGNKSFTKRITLLK
jgi:hypothetical protein